MPDAAITVAHPGDAILPGDRLEELNTTLDHFAHMCDLLSAFAGAQGPRHFTDGLSLEMYASLFGWIGDELHDVRLSLNELHQELLRG